MGRYSQPQTITRTEVTPAIVFWISRALVCHLVVLSYFSTLFLLKDMLPLISGDADDSSLVFVGFFFFFNTFFPWSLSAILEPLLRKLELFGSWVQVELPKELTKASRSWQASWKVISMDSEVNARLSHLKSLSLDHPENSRLLSCVKGWAPVFSGTHLVHSPGPLLASRGWPSGWGGEGANSSREPRS